MAWLLYLFVFILLSTTHGQRTCDDYKDCSTCTGATDCTGGGCTWCASSSTCVQFLLNLCPLSSRVNVPYNCPRPMPDGVENNYDDTFARTNLTNLLCGSNEGNSNATQDALRKVYPSIVVPGYYSVDCLEDNALSLFGYGKKSSKCSAYVAIYYPENVIFLVFSTTADPTTVSANLGNPLSFPTLVPSPAETGRVYSIFSEIFSKIWQTGLANDYRTLLSAVPGYKTIILGYSVGGGVASIAADVISKRFLEAPRKLKLFTFASPRVGDLDYVMNHEQMISSTFRVINQLDPLPLIPPRDFNIDPPFHYRYEVWYKSGTETKDFTVFHMAEDPSGRISNFLSSNNDGVNYFGRNLLTCRL